MVKSDCKTFCTFNTGELHSKITLLREILEEYRDKTTEQLQACTQYEKYTALHVACKQGHTEVVKALLHSLETCDQQTIHSVLLMKVENDIGDVVRKGP